MRRVEVPESTPRSGKGSGEVYPFHRGPSLPTSNKEGCSNDRTPSGHWGPPLDSVRSGRSTDTRDLVVGSTPPSLTRTESESDGGVGGHRDGGGFHVYTGAYGSQSTDPPLTLVGPSTVHQWHHDGVLYLVTLEDPPE